MRARVVVKGIVVGDIEFDWPKLAGEPKAPGPADPVTIALYDEHPDPEYRPLFLAGRLEQLP